MLSGFIILIYVTVNIFGNGAAYCTLTNPTVVISLSGCWAATCALNKKREARDKNLPARWPRTSVQSDD